MGVERTNAGMPSWPNLTPKLTFRRPASLSYGAGKSAMCLLLLCVFELNNACYSTRPYNEGRRFQ